MDNIVDRLAKLQQEVKERHPTLQGPVSICVGDDPELRSMLLSMMEAKLAELEAADVPIDRISSG
jgi:hypothetical protein